MTRLTDEQVKEALRGTIFEDDLLTGHIMDSEAALRLLAEALVIFGKAPEYDCDAFDFYLGDDVDDWLTHLEGGDE